MKKTQAALALAVTGVIVMGLMLTGARSDMHADRRAVVLSSVIGVTAVCKDGMYSTAKRKRGTCSNHGGVKEWIIE